MSGLSKQAWINRLSAIYCSTEQKAIDGAEILARHLELDYQCNALLGENDRSATGYLESEEFERTADAFFSLPEQSVRGWETAKAAQSRIVDTVRRIDQSEVTTGDIAIVSHGAVGTLLYCDIAGKPISRIWNQPGQGGGNYLKLRLSPVATIDWWKSIDCS